MSLSGTIQIGLNDKKVIASITEIYRQRGYHLTDTTRWLTTREISEVANINIYQTRYSLLKLKASGIVILASSDHKRSLRWQPSDIFPRS